jgi:hypothetical protein
MPSVMPNAVSITYRHAAQVLFVPAAWAQGDINLADSIGVSSELGYTNHTMVGDPARTIDTKAAGSKSKKARGKKKKARKQGNAWKKFAGA